jgi:hypothetical protein
MRLTLRTLLAYLNQSNLNLRAVERIEAKVKASPAAGKLIEDLKRMTGDPGIAALPTECDERHKDANWVAEYLDNTLDEEKVEAFEKSAFESTLLLSEIAGCHEILSAICRNETAAASAALRQRAYEIGRVPLDQTSWSGVLDIEYLGGGSRGPVEARPATHQFAADFKQAEAEFRLGPPPEENQRHDEWVDNLSEELEELHHKSSNVWPIALFVGSLALLALAVWSIIRARW